MLKVVFDTVVFVRALIHPDNFCGRALVQHFADYRLFLSRPMVREILEVLHREELTTRFQQLGGLDLARIIELVGEAEIVDLPVVPKVSRDPKDDVFLATALAAGADYLVSEDKDLLDLDPYKGTRILRCAEFLEVLVSGSARGTYTE